MTKDEILTLSDVIFEVLINYRLMYTQTEDEEPYPLLDAVTPLDKSVSLGEEELSELSYAIAEKVAET